MTRSRGAASAALTLAVVGVVAAGCGNEAGDVARDPESASSAPTQTEPTQTEPTETSETGSGGQLPVGETVELEQAQAVTASNVAGEVESHATDISQAAGRDAYVARLDPMLGSQVSSAAARVKIPAATSLYAAVVTVGCKTPTAIDYEAADGQVSVSASVPKGKVQCLVPMTTVVLFLVAN